MAGGEWDLVEAAAKAARSGVPNDVGCQAVMSTMTVGSGSYPLYYAFLFHVARLLSPSLTVEIGTCFGWGTLHLARGCPSGRVVSIDPDPHVDEEPMRSLLKACGNVEIWTGRSESLEIYKALSDIDLLFVDSSHVGEQPRRDWEIYQKRVRPGGLMLFDDLRLTREMLTWWESAAQPKIELPDLHAGCSFGVIAA